MIKNSNHKNSPIVLTIPKRPQTANPLPDKELREKLQHSYEQSLAGKGRPFKDVFDDLEKGLDQRQTATDTDWRTTNTKSPLFREGRSVFTVSSAMFQQIQNRLYRQIGDEDRAACQEFSTEDVRDVRRVGFGIVQHGVGKGHEGEARRPPEEAESSFDHVSHYRNQKGNRQEQAAVQQ